VPVREEKTEGVARGRKAGAFSRLAVLLVASLVAWVGDTPSAQALLKDMPDFYLKKPSEDVPVDVLAETIIYDEKTKTGTALGHVQVKWGPYLLLARKVVYHLRTRRFEAEGEVYIREPKGNVLLADYGEIDKWLRDGFARHLRLLMTNGATLRSRYAVRKEGNITIYTDNAYTACKKCKLPSGVPFWELRSTRAVHDQAKGRIYHRNMTFNLMGTPIFWLPWFSHPDPDHPRSSGFLSPEYGTNPELGFGITVPYFINLDPSYDITLKPTFYTRQGVLGRALWRHNVGPGTYTIDAGGIYQLEPDMFSGVEKRRLRWHVKGKGEFRINRRWKWGFAGAMQSDREMMRRYGIDSADKIHSRLWLEGLNGRNYFYSEAGYMDGLREQEENRGDLALLPWLYQEYTFAPPIMGGVLSLDSTVRSIMQREAHTPFGSVHVPRYQSLLATRLQWRREWITDAGVQVQPFMSLRNELRYVKELPDPSSPGGVRNNAVSVRAFPAAGLDVRMPFLGGMDGGHQVLTPVAQLIAAPGEYGRNKVGNEDSSSPTYSATTLFLEDRYPGWDRFEGGVRLNAGILYGAYWNNGAFLHASLGQTYHLIGRNSFAGTNIGLQRKRADLVGSLALSVPDMVTLSWQGRFDARTLRPRDQQAQLRLNLESLTADINYVRLMEDQENGRNEFDQRYSTALTWKFESGFKIFGGWSYSLRDKHLISRYLGVGYDCDCAQISLRVLESYTGKVDSKFDRTFSLYINLYTLGSLGQLIYKPSEWE